MLVLNCKQMQLLLISEFTDNRHAVQLPVIFIPNSNPTSTTILLGVYF